MKEYQKKTAKDFLKKIVDKMKGDKPDIKTTTPDNTVTGRKYSINKWGDEVGDPDAIATRTYKPEAKGNPSADMGRRLKQESDDFYNSDAGKGVNPSVFSKAIGSWKNQGTGKIGNHVMKPSNGEYVNDPYTAMKYTNMAKKQRDLIRNQGVAGFPDFDKIDKTKVTKINGMSDTQKAILGGAAGATGGEIINDAMDLNQAYNRRDAELGKNQSQQDAHSYWSRKKSGQ